MNTESCAEWVKELQAENSRLQGQLDKSNVRLKWLLGNRGLVGAVCFYRDKLGREWYMKSIEDVDRYMGK